VSTGRTVRRWAARPSGRFVVPGLLVAGLLAVSASAGAYVVPAIAARVSPSPTPAGAASNGDTQNQAPNGPDPSQDPNLGPLPGSSGGTGNDGTGTGTGSATTAGRPQAALAGWAQKLAGTVGIPVLALQAYGYAQLWEQQSQPGCHLTWTTLAGIGKIESDHGREGGASIQPDGRALPPIIGPALNGTGGLQRIADTDHGTLDGDPAYDHAVGPMQFLPATWAQYQIDGDQDGTADPNDINDAAVAAAKYLCAGGRDLSTAGGWWSAVLAYNAIQSYAQDVFTAANDYGIKSRTVT
jgi:hypothetical protein